PIFHHIDGADDGSLITLVELHDFAGKSVPLRYQLIDSRRIFAANDITWRQLILSGNARSNFHELFSDNSGKVDENLAVFAQGRPSFLFNGDGDDEFNFLAVGHFMIVLKSDLFDLSHFNAHDSNW